MKKSPKNVKDVYLTGYARMDNLKQDPRLKIILDLLPTLDLPPNASLLDIGCGDGLFTLQMAKILNTKKLYGIDIAPEAAKVAAKKGIETIVMDIDEQDLLFKNDSFDFIFCGNLIELVLNADHLLTEIHRTLKPGGKVIITFPNIAAWGSRLSLLLGYMPFFSRVSNQYDLGKLTGGIKRGRSTGFIRLFNLTTFIQLAQQYGLKTIVSKGSTEKFLPSYLKKLDSILTKKPSLAFHLICVLSKE